MKKEGTCTALAFYDLEKDSIDLRGLFTFFEDWFLEQGYTPMRGSADGEGIKATKTWTFKYTKKFLEKRNFEKIIAFWFAAYPPEWDYDATDCLLSVNLSTNRNVFDFYFHNSVVPFERGLIESLIKDISRYLKAQYGIVYQRDFDKGPGLYAGGVITGLDGYKFPEQEEEEKRIAEWHRRYFRPWRYHLGQLRDVYPMNLLSDAHLKEPVFGKTLKEWIESSPNHGELKPLTDILWEWWVPENKISAVREELRPTGLIICI
ncbi:MAG: hypothetical protein ACD_16C00227G0010 [uncultured bacterium]|nr:MAG: hypothetical protein ACD_16C00227G0010 [uncultured bacterium]OFW69255.1 MAG: hypothetical protein A2X70_03140 [Alphaproteobacteria bacterium GWC2_42_16]OFW74000.1 MAG: hypothetical protein A2Z80_01655 [Alphaproteobacteria bacterium GWA2_41_27]OFW83205.1 MAG: hypothetical protein A3E50_00465 [Alphaproteobacteria bacterium RIFCSPHIGHO2_12_FULL_42_100]OFW86738.1 MAG: hypothetical protein A2W06_06315 [Alphaproteobacteria bacterium RBG_16_42_14]OFW90780.1 MAG: hypothetical protein A2W46_068